MHGSVTIQLPITFVKPKSMDALIGFLGSCNTALMQRMAAAMQHRGCLLPEQSLVHQEGTLARLQLHQFDAIGLNIATRALSKNDCSFVLCGYLTSIDGQSSVHEPLHWIANEFSKAGLNALTRLRGAYLLAILEHRSKRLHVVRDAAGIRTAAFGRIGNQWMIASEPKSITSEAGFSKAIRPAAIAQYLAFSFVPGVGTMLEDLFEIPCGHAVTLENGCEPRLTSLFEFERHQSLAQRSSQLTSEEEVNWIKKTKDVISKSVCELLPRGEPVGIFLSGGLDSSLVAAEVAKQHSHRVLTYSIHFGPKYPHELAFAASVAKRYSTQHHEILIKPRDFSSRFEQMVWHLDDPIGDPITQPNFELAKRVSQDVRYVFNGEGGDPVFGGPKNLPMLLQHWYNVPRRQNFRELAYLASYRRAYEECEPLLHDSIKSKIDWQRDLEALLSPYFQNSETDLFLNKLMSINIRLKGAHLILPKVERMLAAWGLTPLSPLFDSRLIELSFQMPPRMKLRDGIEKWVLKKAYEADLPSEIIDRPKSGMRVPVHYWFLSDMRRLARRTLRSRSCERAKIFKPMRVKSLLRYDNDEGPGRFGIRLWMLLTFETWRQNLARQPVNEKITNLRQLVAQPTAAKND